MKAKILPALIILSVILFTLPIGVQAQDTSSDKQVLAMLKDFYTSYITQNSNEAAPDNAKAQNAIKTKYCTTRLLSEIKRKMAKDELDYDPFLNAQDCDIAWLKTLSVEKSKKPANTYVASYLDGYSKDKVLIYLKVIKQKGAFKIDSVW